MIGRTTGSITALPGRVRQQVAAGIFGGLFSDPDLYTRHRKMHQSTMALPQLPHSLPFSRYLHLNSTGNPLVLSFSHCCSFRADTRSFQSPSSMSRSGWYAGFQRGFPAVSPTGSSRIFGDSGEATSLFEHATWFRSFPRRRVRRIDPSLPESRQPPTGLSDGTRL